MISNTLQFLSQHVFLILPLSIILMVAGFLVFNKKKPFIKFVLLFFPIFGVINLIYSSDWNTNYIIKHGVEGEGVVTSIVPTNNYINHVQVFEYNCTLKTATGKQVSVVFENNEALLYPKDQLNYLPTIGSVFKVKYIPTDEDNFVILTHKSPEQHCLKLMQNIGSANALYQLDKSNLNNKNRLKKELQLFLKAPCDTNVQKGFQLLLDQLK
ncbi:hypothetical protein [Fluviicola sp.]|uniref:hypothetical protein n=1 Tax=Fluviicola sp. TaxID=1917219 RepID=UPI003D2E4AD3